MVKLEVEKVQCDTRCLPLRTELFQNLRSKPGFCLIDAPCASDPKRVLIFLDPVLEIKGGKDWSRVLSGKEVVFHSHSCTAALDQWLSSYTADESPHSSANSIPCIAGFMSYELGYEFEGLSSQATTIDTQLPLYRFWLYRSVLESGSNGLVHHHFSDDDYSTPLWPDFDISNVLSRISSSSSPAKHIQPEVNTGSMHLSQLEQYSNFSRSDYIDACLEIQERIRAGAVYQVNLSQQFTVPIDSHSLDLYTTLCELSPAQHSAYIQMSDIEDWAIVCSSPELFLRRSGHEVLSSPIKGTRPRGASLPEDTVLRNSLVNSEKDRAELTMIVDLIRNDLGRVAEIGSVQVVRYPRVETLPQVHHLVSDIRCCLRKDVKLAELLATTFPCGSITGAPKISAMKTIAELEPTPRGVYTGSIGTISLGGDLLLNVAIRSGIVRNSSFTFHSGAGIVIDSDPQAEYWETLHKASGLWGSAELHIYANRNTRISAV